MSTHQNYYTTLKDGNKHDVQTNASCFGSLTYCSIPKEAVSVTVYHTLRQIPYKEEEVIQWIADVNEWGFPVEYRGIQKFDLFVDYEKMENEKCYVFEVPLKPYKLKAHFSSALMLVRYLIEDYIHHLPKYYFELVKAAPETDKFKLMQLAHLFYSFHTYYNANHTLRTYRNQQLLDKEEIFKRFKTSKHLLRGRLHASVATIWNAENDFNKNYIEDDRALPKEVKNKDYAELINKFKLNNNNNGEEA